MEAPLRDAALIPYDPAAAAVANAAPLLVPLVLAIRNAEAEETAAAFPSLTHDSDLEESEKKKQIVVGGLSNRCGVAPFCACSSASDLDGELRSVLFNRRKGADAVTLVSVTRLTRTAVSILEDRKVRLTTSLGRHKRRSHIAGPIKMQYNYRFVDKTVENIKHDARPSQLLQVVCLVESTQRVSFAPL